MWREYLCYRNICKNSLAATSHRLHLDWTDSFWPLKIQHAVLMSPQETEEFCGTHDSRHDRFIPFYSSLRLSPRSLSNITHLLVYICRCCEWYIDLSPRSLHKLKLLLTTLSSHMVFDGGSSHSVAFQWSCLSIWRRMRNVYDCRRAVTPTVRIFLFYFIYFSLYSFFL